MNKNLIVLGLSIGLLSCNQTTKEVSVKEQIILTEAAAEPTKPEETEVWGAKAKNSNCRCTYRNSIRCHRFV